MGVGCHYGHTLIKDLTYKTTLRIFLLFSFLLISFLVNCSTDPRSHPITASVKLRTSSKQLQSNFDSCLGLTQQLIKTQISDKEFFQFFKFDKRSTGFEYENVVFSVSDTLSQIPKVYQIFYEFIFKGDTISAFRVDYDSTLKIIDYRNFHLSAFKKFIDGKLTITKSLAINIAVRNKMIREGLDPILNCSADKFYWECRNDCNDCIYFEIDAKSGGIIGRGKVVYEY